MAKQKRKAEVKAMTAEEIEVQLIHGAANYIRATISAMQLALDMGSHVAMTSSWPATVPWDETAEALYKTLEALKAKSPEEWVKEAWEEEAATTAPRRPTS